MILDGEHAVIPKGAAVSKSFHDVYESGVNKDFTLLFIKKKKGGAAWFLNQK